MKLGAEPKKIVILAGLLVVALLVFVFNGGSGSGSSPSSAAVTPRPNPAVSPGGLPSASPGAAASTAPARRGRTSAEFRPYLGRRPGQPVPDPMGIDPTLRLDVLARLQNVEVTGTHRSLFDFGQAPPPKTEPAKVAAAKVKVPSPIVPIKSADANPTPGNIAPSKPTAPPVPLKFFGYVNPSGQAQKRAFFMEGDEIHVVTEGEMVKRRYKIVRIGVNSVVVEDVQFPGSQQTLPLEEQPG